MAAPAFGRINLTATPKGLKTVDWQQIRAEYERHRHAAFKDGEGLKARSFEQQWLTRFDGRGFTVEPDGTAWRWGLELAGVTGKAQVSADVNRITYRWGAGLDEWFLNDTRGLEHGFTLRVPRQDLWLAVRGGMHPRLSGKNVEFVDHAGTARVTYSELAAHDADGRVLQTRVTVAGDEVLLAVEDRGARYPVTIDPIARQAY